MRKLILKILCGGRRLQNRVIFLLFLSMIAGSVLWMGWYGINSEITEPTVQLPIRNIPETAVPRNALESDTLMDYENGKFEAGSDLDLPGLTDSRHKLAVIVPYRDSQKELEVFVPYIHMYLTTKMIKHKIYVINQVDKYRFNRGSLINVGFFESIGECDYIVMHDVDLLPINLNLSYSFPKKGPMHLAAPELHPIYGYAEFIGGVLLISSRHFQKMNGMSNRYWGWGREDDEFYQRIKTEKLTISRPQNITTGKKTFFHIHNKERKRDYSTIKLPHAKFGAIKVDNETGLSTLEYFARSRQNLSINGAPYDIIDVELDCDKSVSPWCVPGYEKKEKDDEENKNEKEDTDENDDEEHEDNTTTNKATEISKNYVERLKKMKTEDIEQLLRDTLKKYNELSVIKSDQG